MTWLLAIGGFLKRMPWQVYAALALLAACWLWGNHRYSQGVHHERAKWEAAQAAAKQRADAATVKASDQRAADTIRNHDLEKARTDAINQSSPGIAPDDANRRLACERLRAAGIDAPASCL